LPAVVIVIEEGAAGAKSFGEKFAAVGAAIVAELDAGGICDVYQAKAGGCGLLLLRRGASEDVWV
jgi:hypothetical protein